MTPHIRGGNSAIEDCREYSDDNTNVIHESSYGGEIDSTLVITQDGRVIVIDGEYDVLKMSTSPDDIERFMGYLHVSSHRAQQLIEENNAKLSTIESALQ